MTTQPILDPRIFYALTFIEFKRSTLQRPPSQPTDPALALIHAAILTYHNLIITAIAHGHPAPSNNPSHPLHPSLLTYDPSTTPPHIRALIQPFLPLLLDPTLDPTPTPPGA